MTLANSLLARQAIIKVVGVSNYADVVATLRTGQPVRVSHEPTNAYDPNAMRVDTLEGQTIGYVPAALAARMVSELDGQAFRGHVAETREHDRVTVGASIVLDGVAA